MDQHLNHLAFYGYAVIPFIPTDDVQSTRGRFLKTGRAFPEYNNMEDQFQFVAGGFSAFGNSASFHNPFVREMRQKAFDKHCELFKGTGLNGHVLFDRMMLRPAGKAPTKEAWHRDVTPNLADDDTMYGGWINFDSLPQFFSCVPESHNDAKDAAVGFSLIRSETQLDRCRDEKRMVEIPMGHMIIFYQNLIHEVLAKKRDHHQYRLFTPFRTTPGIERLFVSSYDEAILNQGVPLIPSGQSPTVWPSANWNYPKQRPGLEAFSSHFKDVACQGKRKLLTDLDVPPMRIVWRKMRGLRQLGLPMYPDYTQAERDIFVPTALGSAATPAPV
jgi:hypothetical protein